MVYAGVGKFGWSVYFGWGILLDQAGEGLFVWERVVRAGGGV